MIEIHQIWIDYKITSQASALKHEFSEQDLPQKYSPCIESWKALATLPENTHTLWTTRKSAEFLRDVAGAEWTSLYWSLKYPVMRTDLLRLLILQHLGGVYTDIDVEIRDGRREHASALLNALSPNDVLLSPIRCLGNGSSALWLPNNDIIAVKHANNAYICAVLDRYLKHAVERRSFVVNLLGICSDFSEIAKCLYVAMLGPFLMHTVYSEFERRPTTPPTRFLIFPKVRVANTMMANQIKATNDCSGSGVGLDVHSPLNDVFLDRSSGSWFGGGGWFSFNRFAVESVIIVIGVAFIFYAFIRIVARLAARSI